MFIALISYSLSPSSFSLSLSTKQYIQLKLLKVLIKILGYNFILTMPRSVFFGIKDLWIYFKIGKYFVYKLVYLKML